jgi:K+-transporting ATPase A subunit
MSDLYSAVQYLLFVIIIAIFVKSLGGYLSKVFLRENVRCLIAFAYRASQERGHVTIAGQHPVRNRRTHQHRRIIS